MQFVKGVGPRRAAGLRALGIHTVGDLIAHIPHRYETQEPARPIDQLRLDETATVVGRIHSLRRRGGYQRSSLLADLEDGTGRCHVRWFHPGRLIHELEVGTILRVHGKVGEYNNLAVFTNPAFRRLDEADVSTEAERPRIVPIYAATNGLSSGEIGRAIRTALPLAMEAIRDPLDAAFRKSRELPPRRSAVHRVHEPTCDEDAIVARRRLAYDELLLLQLALQLRRRGRVRADNAPRLVCTPEIDRRIRARYPFALTEAQSRVITEVIRDMNRTAPMNRLLQGDVGCGKTVVALYALLVAVANGRQGVLMAPTEVLAEQHMRRIDTYLAGSRVRWMRLVGGMKPSARREAYQRVATGEVDLIVGTHALLQRGVQFRSLGLVVVDEQHKFGVRQRASLRAKGPAPHFLVMTATPIPRTLAMTAFGDLDVSWIDELPPGRKPVQTIAVSSGEAEPMWTDVRARVQAGEQAYVVYPLIDESDRLPLRAARAEFDRLSNTVFDGLPVGLLHGRLPAEEKDRVLARFAVGELAALVSTTVIEVGIDVPNATTLVVEHAERLGLSQLHQLRGRVARGARTGLCALVHEGPNEAAAARLAVLCRTSDGFEIAEEDLRMRGPGELLGTRQHGLPELRVADLTRDIDVLIAARNDAAAITAADPTLTRSRHRELRAELLDRYADSMAWIDVG